MPPKPPNFDQAAAGWDDKPRRVKLAHDIAAAVLREIPLRPDMQALDFGCGTGLVTLRLAPLVKAVTGADTSRGMLQVLQGKIDTQGLVNVRTLYLDPEVETSLTGSYDLIVSSMTLHHIADLAPLLAQFHTVLAPGGYLALADLDPEGGRFHTDNTGVHHFGFERAALARALNAAGFSAVRDVTAATVEKSTATGETEEFTVFLLIGRKGIVGFRGRNMSQYHK